MAFDGFLMAALTKELSDRLTGGHLQKFHSRSRTN